MTADQKQKTKFTRTATFKGIVIALMTLLMLIPGCMVQNLIRERQATRDEAVRNIDAKWSYAQTVSGPILTVPFIKTVLDMEKKPVLVEDVINITPEQIDIKTELFPEERYYGIYKTIVYKSIVTVTGKFSPVEKDRLPEEEIHWERAYLRFGVSDLRGISDNIAFEVNDSIYTPKSTGYSDVLLKEVMKVSLIQFNPEKELEFDYTINLKGSGSINFIPVGRTTDVTVAGLWPDPGFIGNYTPDYTLENDSFRAHWKILNFNRNIPDIWSGNFHQSVDNLSFGVNLVDTVDIYQQNMRSAKYALMFIALTFVIFFFVEIKSRKRIHPIQYILIGIALILFYGLLLSISEPLGFGWAYLISSIATIGLITAYASKIFKNKNETISLALILSGLYIFLYVLLQLKDMALLAGSVGLFVVLGIIMYFSQKINWYGEEK